MVLPGNGGLDLRVQRSYNSRIWGRTDVSFPGLVAINELSVMGIGWSFHFGRVRNPFGTGSSNRFVPDNPVVEMPDGSIHPLYRDKNVTTRFISREYWRYENTSTGTLIKYDLTLTDGTVYTFPQTNAYGTADGVTIHQVGTITTPNGNTISFTYDSLDPRLLTSVADSTGRTITFTYTTFTGVTSGSDKALTAMNVNGRTYTYAYQLIDGKLFLSAVTPPVGPSWKYTYHQTAPQTYELRTVAYPTGAVLSYGYGDVWFDVGPTAVMFRVVTGRTLSGRGLTTTSWSYSYAANSLANQVTTITQSGCRMERYTYSSFGSLSNTGLSNQLWRIGTLVKKEILNGATVVQTETYAWAPSASISLDDLPNGNWNGTGGQLYDGEIFVPLLTSRAVTRGGRTYTTSYGNYDAFGNPQAISETGDASRTTALTYFSNTARNIVKDRPASEAVTVGLQTFTTTFGYDPNGNLTTVNRFGVVTTFGYTGGNLTSRTNARNVTTTFQYSRGVVSAITNPVYSITRSINWAGTIASETDGRLNTTSFSYDALDRLAAISPPLEASTTISYDNVGASFWKVTKGVTFTQSTVDGLGRVTSTSASEGINTRSTYNVCGQKTYQSYPHTTTNIGDSFTYDVLDRVTKVTHPDLTPLTYAYAGSDVSITDERGITRSYGYTAFGNPDEKRLDSVADATGTTAYAYNAVGSLTGITHPGGLSRSFSYDAKNFLIGETQPETGTLTYGRDAVGNLTGVTDGRGTTVFTYDAIDRLLSLDYPIPTPDVSFTYDRANNRTATSSTAASMAYTYDAANRLTGQTVTTDGRSYSTAYGYDTRGNVTSLTYPTGRVLAYTYDTANRVTSLTGYVTSVTYHPSGAMASLAYANGKSTTFAYDNRYRPTSISATGVLGLTYAYDGVGNVTSIVDGLNASRNRTMAYDGLDRLLSASGVWGSMSFAYSPLGNRTSKTLNGATTTYSYSAATNRLVGASGAEPDSYLYDASGNMTSIRGLGLAYDFANRLTSVNAGAVTYTYDGDGRRIKKVDGQTGDTVLYHDDRAGRVLAETHTIGTPWIEYLYVNGQHVARIDTLPPPDLVVSALSTATVVVGTGSGLTLSNTVENRGGSPAGAFDVAFHLSTDAIYGGLDDIPFVTTRSVASLAAGATSADATTVTVPSTTPPGYYYLCAAADSAGTVAEGNEANNTACTTSTVAVQTTGSAPVTLFADSFTGAPSATWTPSPLGRAAGWSVVADAFHYDGGGPSQMITGSATWTDYSFEAKVRLSTLVGLPGGLRGRVDPATGAGYAVWLYPATGEIKLWRTTGWAIDSPGLTLLGSASGIVFDTIGFHMLKLVFNGSLIEVWYDGVLRISAQDSTYAAGVVALDVSDQVVDFDDVLVIRNPANLQVSPQSLFVSATIGAPAPLPQTITATRTGGDQELLFGTGVDAPWLAASPASATTPAQISVSVNPTGLAAGPYSGLVMLTAPSTERGGEVVPVTLTVHPAGTLFADDFSAGTASNWSASPLGLGGGWSVVGGAFRYGGGGESQMLAGDPAWTDYVVEAKVTLSTLLNFPGGLRGRVNPATGAGYAVSLSPETGEVRLLRSAVWDINDPSTAVLGSAAGVTFTTGTPLTIALRLVGSQIDVVVGGVTLISVIDAALTSGQIALEGASQPVVFDDVLVRIP